MKGADQQMQPDLKLECKELQIDSESLERFIRRDVAGSIPLAVYAGEDKQWIDFVVAYLSVHKPYLTDIRFVDSEGKEPRYVRVSPTMDMQDPEVWDVVYNWLAQIFKRLRGSDNTCLVSGWRLVTKWLPPDYRGEVIPRGIDRIFEVLLEWTEQFEERDTFVGVWEYNSVGYIVPNENMECLRKWTRIDQLTPSLVEEFFSKVLCLFYAKYELEGIWVMSHVLDSKTICERIGVKEINEKIAQGIKAW